MSETFTQTQLEALARALGATNSGLRGSEIGFLLQTAKIDDPGVMTKHVRLYNAFAENQNKLQHRKNILAFLRFAMKPEKYITEPERYEPLRAEINKALAFAGLFVTEAGVIERAAAVSTLSESRRRAEDLRADMQLRNVHADVLVFCRAELLADDYFHAVQEAVKSLGEKLRQRTGLGDDGATLVDRALTGQPPMLAINQLRNDSERSEQSGFANLLKGLFGMFRNPTAHAPRIYWPMPKPDAEDILSIVSLAHRRIDAAYMPPRT